VDAAEREPEKHSHQFIAPATRPVAHVHRHQSASAGCTICTAGDPNRCPGAGALLSSKEPVNRIAPIWPDNCRSGLTTCPPRLPELIGVKMREVNYVAPTLRQLLSAKGLTSSWLPALCWPKK
jgi:hypothetical protein